MALLILQNLSEIKSSIEKKRQEESVINERLKYFKTYIILKIKNNLK